MSTNPYATPKSQSEDPAGNEVEYAGFWIRTGATLIDALLIVAITYPLLFAIYGSEYFAMDKSVLISGPADFLLTYIAPAAASIWFWRAKQGTPGKMLLSLRVVDAQTGNGLSLGQAIGRYLAYFVSALPAGLGFLWIAFDARKQGWHDKLAKTMIVRALAKPADR